MAGSERLETADGQTFIGFDYQKFLDENPPVHDITQPPEFSPEQIRELKRAGVDLEALGVIEPLHSSILERIYRLHFPHIP